MLYVDIPTLPEVKALVAVRADACISICVPTTPQTQQVGASRIAFGNLAKAGLAQLDDVGFDKRRRALIAEQIDDLAADEDFWAFQANSLAVLLTPEKTRTYRLPNRLEPTVQVSDRFHVTSLLRSITFPHRAFVLAAAENGTRLVEVFGDLPASEVKIRDMPKDAGSAVGRASVNDRSSTGRIYGSEGENVLLRQYARQVDAALRPILAGNNQPLILAATEPFLSIMRSVTTYPGLIEEAIVTSPGEWTPASLADAARPILDDLYAKEVAAFAELYQTRLPQGRATTDLTHAARAATYGAVDTLLIDIDDVSPGTVDETSGLVTLADGPSATTYGVVDEIAARALLSGANVIGVRKVDIPDGASVAAILRYELL